MLKIVYPICCGIDVHKTFVIACIASTDEVGITRYQSKRFSTFTKGLRELREWLLSNSCTDVCMESTGKYFIPVYNILEDGLKPIVAHPKYVKAIRGKKTDKRDAKWIADLFKHDLIASSFIPDKNIRDLRDLMRYRFKLTNFGSSEKNRFQNCLTVSNIQLASVVSDTFGKSSMNIIEHILENPLDRNIDIPSLIHGSLTKKIPELELAVDGVITETQAEKIKIIKEHYDALDLCKLNLESVILNLSKPYQKEIELLLSVPSINNIFTAIGILSEIGADMNVFPSAKHLCSWAGLTPTNNESAGKKKSVRISRAGCYLKPLLVQCATAVVKSEKHPEIRNRYLNIKKRRGHKKAIIAICRMLLTAIYHILKKQEVYNPDLYKKAELLPVSREITPEQAIYIAQRQGYKVMWFSKFFFHTIFLVITRWLVCYETNEAPKFTADYRDVKDADWQILNYGEAKGTLTDEGDGKYSISSVCPEGEGNLMKTFAYKEVTGDFEIHTKLTGFDATAYDADYFGILATDSLDLYNANFFEERHFSNNNNILMVTHTPEQEKSVQGWWAGDMNGKSVPIHFIIKRTGNQIEYWYSLDDGVTYEQTTKPKVPYDGSDVMYVGFCMTAQKGIENTAHVEDITIKGEMVGEAIKKGETVTLDFTSSDKENDETEFKMLTELPEGARRDGQKIIFTPVREGEYVFTASVKDIYHETPTTKTLKVNVAPIIKLTLNGSYIYSDVSPYISNDRTMVPIRVISESLGADVDWNGDTREVTVKKDGNTVKLTINSANATVNGALAELDAPAVIKESRTFVPIRFISENLGWKVDWDSDSYTVLISE